jgi:hypothetical protein
MPAIDLEEFTAKATPRLDEMQALLWSLVQESSAHWQGHQARIQRQARALAWARAAVVSVFGAGMAWGLSGSALAGLATLVAGVPALGIKELSSSKSNLGRWSWPDRLELLVCPAHPANAVSLHGLMYANGELHECKLPSHDPVRTRASVYLMLYLRDRIWGQIRLDDGVVWVNSLDNDNTPWAKAMTTQLLRNLPARVHELHQELLDLLKPALPAAAAASQEKADPWQRLILHGNLKDKLRQSIEALFRPKGSLSLAITGGQGSGKSLLADIIQDTSPIPVYVSDAAELSRWCEQHQERRLAEFSLKLFGHGPKLWIIDQYEQGFHTEESALWLKKLWKSLNEQGVDVSLLVLSRRAHKNWSMFAQTLEIEAPDRVARRELLKHFIEREGALDEATSFFDHILELTDGYSAGQLKVVANKAAQLALERALVAGVSCASIASVGRKPGAIRRLTQEESPSMARA